MRKTLLLYCWLLTPIALLAYHYGPGQSGLARDVAAEKMGIAQTAEQSEDWPAAVAAYAEALEKTPVSDTAARWQLRLAHSKARMQIGEIPEAIAEMDGMLAEMEKANAPATRQDDVRTNLATAEYYAAWLMRLEGASSAEWMIQAESARQNFRLLAENNLASDPAGAIGQQENLEAAIRLQRMDLSELQSLPLPKVCQGCKNVSQKCRSQCQSQCKKPGEKKAKDARGGGTGEIPRGGS